MKKNPITQSLPKCRWGFFASQFCGSTTRRCWFCLTMLLHATCIFKYVCMCILICFNVALGLSYYGPVTMALVFQSPDMPPHVQCRWHGIMRWLPTQPWISRLRLLTSGVLRVTWLFSIFIVSQKSFWNCCKLMHIKFVAFLC